MILAAVASNLVIQGYKGYSLSTQGNQASRISNLGITRVGDGDTLYLDKDVGDLSDGEVMSITLITGDTISILKKDGRVSVAVKPVKSGRNFYVFPRSDTLYVIPEDVDLNRFDIELFNIKLLAEHINITRGRLPLIVKVRDSTPVDRVTRSIRRMAEEVDGLGYKGLEIINSIALRIPTQEKEEVSKFYEVLAADQHVEKVVLDRIYKINSGENIGVQLYESVPLIGAPSLWELGIDGSGYTIAILDTGIDPNHPDFYVDGESKIVAIENFVDWDFDGEPDEPPIDGHGHGTHCAGIAAGVGGYLDFIKGVAPGASLMVGKVLSDLGYGHDSWIISGIEWAVENGVDVISMSLGGSASISYDPLVAAVNWAVDQGVVVVIAAGNSGPGYFTVASPGVSPKAITVGAVDKTLNIASFSSRGPTPNATLKPDVVAPGVDIASSRAWRTYMGEPASVHHVYASGTSMATPHIAGLATLVLQLLEEQGILEEVTSSLGITGADVVKNIIISTAEDLGLDPFTQGAGFVNALKLLELLESRRLVIVDPARIDVVKVEDVTETLVLTLYNPFDEDISATIDIEFKPWVSLRDSIYDAITVEPEEVTIPANSYTTISVSIDFSQVPAGYHALVLKIVSDGKEIGRVLIGVSKPQLLKISTLLNGEPYTGWIFVYAIAFSPALNQQISLSGYDWGWIAYGKGEVSLYPLYPDTIYLIEVASFEEPYIVYTVMATDSTTNVYSLEIDFAEVEPKYITVADNLAGYAFVSYGVRMVVKDATNNVVANITNADGTLIFLDPEIDNEIRYGLYVDSLVILGYIVELSTRYFGVKAEVRDIGDPSKPIWIFYRVYGAPSDIFVQPTVVSRVVYHVHSAISSSKVEGLSALTILGGAVDIDGAITSSVIHPSYTVYNIDINVGISAIRTLNMLTIPSEDGDYLSITAYQFTGLRMDSGYLFAPLASPLAGSTIWSYSMLLQGLDPNNFTYSTGQGHTFRATFTKSYSVSGGYPISYALLKINNQSVVSTLDTNALTYYLEGFNWNNTELARVQYRFTLDLSRYEILRVSNYAYSLATIQFAEPNYAAYKAVNAFGYGIGLRDVLAVGGFNYLYNYLPGDQQTYLYLFINRPADTNIGLVSRKVKLVGYANGMPKEIELPTEILGITSAYYLARASVDASQILQHASPGAFDLVVELLYRHSLTGDEVAYYLYVSNAMYIGVSAYVPPVTPTPTPTPTETTPTETTPIATTVTVTQTVTLTETITTTVVSPTTTTVISPTTVTQTVSTTIVSPVTITVTQPTTVALPPAVVTTTIRVTDTATLLLTVTDIRTVSIPITILYTYTITSPYTTTITTSIPTTIISPTTVVQPTTLTTTIDRTRTVEVSITTTETKLQTIEVERTSTIRETIRETVTRTLTSTITQPTTLVSTVYEVPGWVTPIVAVLAIIAIGSMAVCVLRCRKP